VAAGNPRAEARSRNKRRSSFGKRTEMRPLAGTGSGVSMTVAGVAGPSEASTIRFKSVDSDVFCSRASAAKRCLVSLYTHAIRCRLLLIVGGSLSHCAAARLSCIYGELTNKCFIHPVSTQRISCSRHRPIRCSRIFGFTRERHDLSSHHGIRA
jgi:hypothetical protein